MPDTIRTESELLTLFADAQAAGAISAQDMRDFIISVKYLNNHGWSFHLDGAYTPGSPKTILAGVRTQVTIDGTFGDFGHPEVAHVDGHDWDIPTNKITANALNDFALGRLAVTAQSVSASVNRFELEVDVSTGSFPVIYQETGVLAKGAGNDQNFNFVIPLFVGPDFLTNGAELYITPQSDMEFHTHAITLVQTYVARP